MIVVDWYALQSLGEFNISPHADLSGVTLYQASLPGANLYGANFHNADLGGANLYGADLRKADFSGAVLRRANLSGARLPKFQIPQTKSLLVWKKLCDGLICSLRIPCRAARTASLVGNKCRAQRAVVVGIWDGRKAVNEGYSMHDPCFEYVVGKEVSVTDYNPDIRVECTSGIHFFLKKKDAKNYR